MPEKPSPKSDPPEEGGGHLGEERLGQNVIDVPRPAVDLGAARGDRLDQLLAIGQLGVMAVAHPLADLGELQLHDLPDLRIAERVVGDGHQAAQEGRLEMFQERRPHLFRQPLGIGPGAVAIRFPASRQSRAMTSAPALLVIRMTVFLKSTVTPSPSSRVPLSKT